VLNELLSMYRFERCINHYKLNLRKERKLTKRSRIKLVSRKFPLSALHAPSASLLHHVDIITSPPQACTRSESTKLSIRSILSILNLLNSSSHLLVSRLYPLSPTSLGAFLHLSIPIRNLVDICNLLFSSCEIGFIRISQCLLRSDCFVSV